MPRAGVHEKVCPTDGAAVPFEDGPSGARNGTGWRQIRDRTCRHWSAVTTKLRTRRRRPHRSPREQTTPVAVTPVVESRPPPSHLDLILATTGSIDEEARQRGKKHPRKQSNPVSSQQKQRNPDSSAAESSSTTSAASLGNGTGVVESRSPGPPAEEPPLVKLTAKTPPETKKDVKSAKVEFPCIWSHFSLLGRKDPPPPAFWTLGEMKIVLIAK